MAIVPNFSTSQAAGSLSTVTFTDTSTGTDGAITGRLITIRKYDGNYLVPDGTSTTYIFWPYIAGTGDTISIDILDKDYCLDITVQWYTGSSIGYTKTILTLFTGYGDLFLRQLTQALAANKKKIDDQNFWLNKNKLRVLLDDAAQAVGLLNDQTIAQYCLDAEMDLVNNIQVFF